MGIKNVLVIGNGDLCHAIIDGLTSANNDGPYRVSILTYRGQTPYFPPHVSPGAVQHKTFDLTAASLEMAFAGEDLVISTIAGGNHDLQLQFINAAITAGVRRYIPHEFGHDTINEKIQARITQGSERAKTIEYLRQVQKSEASFEWVGVATGCTLDSILLTGDFGFDFEWQSGTIHGTGNERFPASSLKRIAAVSESVIRHWDLVKNQYVYAAGCLSSGRELVAALENVTGKEWSIGYSDVEDCVREGLARIEKGFPDSGMFLLERSVLYDERLGAAVPFRERSANELLGFKEEDVEAIVGAAYHEFRHRGKPGCGCSS